MEHLALNVQVFDPENNDLETIFRKHAQRVVYAQ